MEHRDLIVTLLDKFDKALSADSPDQAVELFHDECYWRDLVAFTWNITTLEGTEAVRGMLVEQLSRVKPENWRLDESQTIDSTDGVITAWLLFETGCARCSGALRVRDGKIWTLMTSISDLKGHEEALGFDRPSGVEHGAIRERLTWKEEREQELATLGYGEQPFVLIIGGGQGGIALGARLRQLRVPTIIVEKNGRPGDSWRNRYKSLCLHDPVWYDHLPYLQFPPNWPVFSPKDKIADWLEMYTKVMELNYWTETVCKSASYDAETSEWRVEVEREGTDIILQPKHLVFATGMSGKPNVPEFRGMERFKGDQHHSSAHPGPDGYRNKKAVVIGSNNSAHDICAALWEAGADVTMVQRSTTLVARSETLMDIVLGPLYSENAVKNGVTVDVADMIFASIPYGILPDIQKPACDAIRERDADFYGDLERAGFMLDFGDDDTGLFMKYLRRGSGYYIDVGASQLIIDGKIKLKSGSEIAEITEDSVVTADGTKLTADLIVYATGYNSMNLWVADLVGKNVADRVGKCWGLGSSTTKDPGPWEGELRNMWKPTRQEALWFHGGNLHQSRHYSRYLALQLKARMEGIATPVYGLPAVHHTQ